MTSSLAASLASLPKDQRKAILDGLTDDQVNELLNDWRFWARPEQIAPEGDWSTWMVLAGRGFGKSEAGAQWVKEREAIGARSIALVAETQKDLEEVMVPRLIGLYDKQGAPDVRFRPVRITWPSGAVALGYNGTEPNQLRGPEFDTAWCFPAGTMVSVDGGEKAIEDVASGDLVWTRCGLKKVVSTKSRVSKIGSICASDGRALLGTADHKVYTSNGWTRMDSLNVGDMLCAIVASSGVERSGTDTRERITFLTGRNRRADRIGSLCTGLFTSIISAVSQRATIFTTRMGISGTTTPPTWRLSPDPSTWQCTESRNPFLRQITLVGGSCMSVPSAGARLFTKSGAKGLFARLANTAQRKLVERPLGAASSAEQASRAVPETFALSVASTWRPEGETRVYCLTVEGCPEFFANGILVHNCDELAKYRYAREAWDMLQFTMRRPDPRVMVTTTPRPIPVIKEIVADKSTVITRGSTFDNSANLAGAFLRKIRDRYEGTRLGRQELNAEILDDLPGALWTREMIDACRVRKAPEMSRVVVAIDPSGTGGGEDSGDDVGIVIAGKGVDGKAYVLADRTCNLSPDGWGRRAVEAYREFKADRIIAERNFGGAMVKHVIRTVDRSAAYREVTASRGKTARAEPVAALYEQNKVHHVGGFPQLEDQLCQFGPDGYIGDRSPDRADALVWALSELMIGAGHMQRRELII